MVMEVPKLSRDEVIARACKRFNNRKADIFCNRGSDEPCSYSPASPESDPIFLKRISVNYLRHLLSNYEDEAARVYGRVGVRQAYKEISRRVYAAIAEAYTWLKDECQKQLERKPNDGGAYNNSSPGGHRQGTRQA
jgi:hypothetical protein